MGLPVEVSAKAKTDLVRNAFWWAEQHSVLEALEWEEAITRQLEQIGVSPESYGVFQTQNTYQVTLREALVGTGSRKTYRAVFRVETDRIVVVRLLAATQADLTSAELFE